MHIYNIAQTVTQIHTDMTTPVGAATTSAATPQAQTGEAATAAPSAAKLVVSDAKTANGRVTTSTLTPRFKVWTTDAKHRTEVQVIEAPTKSSRGKGLI
ncbi:hypothetical protein [Streptosporangium canum]|uniref:hypothetical protein n=1 Tax=Streptosporangium canum TaxID=324952 RepID=UPI0037A4578E